MDHPQKLGQYVLLDLLAQGGMAQIFKAKTVDAYGLERLVVIKRILPHISADPDYVRMLVDEAKIAVHFTHGTIAQIYDLGCINNDYFIVMEYVDGKTFSQINKRLKQIKRKIPLDILLYCAIEVARGLSYIHNKKDAVGRAMGVVHRDVSPQNIILSYAGHIKIIDFGVAKAHNKEGKTESGVLKGKFAYMSPEQARSDHIDSRSDIFSLGTLLWEMATGERLFKRATNRETVLAIQNTKPTDASRVRRDIPSAFDKIIKKALQKNPKNRYQDASDMVIDLERLLFELNPDFKPVYAAEFVYKLFGPEEDERDLPDHLFVKEPTPVTRVQSLDAPSSASAEEATNKDFLDHGTPVVRTPLKRWDVQNIWLVAFFVFMFLAGAAYVILANRTDSAELLLRGLEPKMTVQLDNKTLNVKGSEKTVKVVVGQTYVLHVHQEGFEDFEKQLVIKNAEDRVVEIKMTKEAVRFGNLIITTRPSGATVYIDNVEWTAPTPLVIRNLDAGRVYRVGLFLKKYKFYTQDVTIVGGQDVTLMYDLVSNFAFLSITTNPIGARVFIDGKEVGVTPYQDSNISPGELHQVSVEKEGYEAQTFSFELKPGDEKQVQLDLVGSASD